jgi:DNA-directed RNA polymerase specialized sigma subunit
MGKLVDLDRELIRKLKSGDTGVWEKLYLCNQNFIRRCAGKTCRKYFCMRLEEDLIGEGNLAFFVHAPNYNPDSAAALTTYLYPHIMGDMRREVEHNYSSASVSKDDFQLMRKVKALYNRGFGIPKIAEAVDLKEPQAKWLLLQALAFFSNYDKSTADLGTARLLVVRDLPVHRQVFLRICLELLKEVFKDELSFKEGEILGGYFGVYEYEKKRLADIGEPFNMKSDAALKAKNEALKKLTALCRNGELGNWRRVYAAVMRCSR